MNIEKLLRAWEQEEGPLTFGRVLRAYRLGEEMTYREFSEELGLSVSSVQDLESGERVPSPKRAAEIAQRLGYSEASFVQLCIQDNLRKSGLKYTVKLESA